MNLNIAREINTLLSNSRMVEYVRQNPEVILIGFLSFLTLIIIMSLFEWGRGNNKSYG